MEEILDIEELNEDIIDENLKEFMKKDEETEKLLSDKINELIIEEEKLTKKEEELKSLEESSREKISTNASADELIEIAGKIKEVETELLDITENVKKLNEEKEELITTKTDIEKSKKEYIKSLKSTSSNYDNQLKKINEAIEVCDNPALKQVFEDVQSKRTNELSEIEEKRVSVLRSILKEEEPKEDIKEEKIIEKEEVPIIVFEPIKEEIKEPITIEENIPTQEVNEAPIFDEVQTSDITIDPVIEDTVSDGPISFNTQVLNNIVGTVKEELKKTQTNIEEQNTISDINVEPSQVVTDELSTLEEVPVSTIDINEPILDQNMTSETKTLDDLLLGGNVTEEVKPMFEEQTPETNIENLDSMFGISNDNISTIQTDELVIPGVDQTNTTSEINTNFDINQFSSNNENQFRIIYKKDVSNNLLKDIYSSSKIMPSLYSFLEGSFN